jgi:hypothetical protein
MTLHSRLHPFTHINHIPRLAVQNIYMSPTGHEIFSSTTGMTIAGFVASEREMREGDRERHEAVRERMRKRAKDRGSEATFDL